MGKGAMGSKAAYAASPARRLGRLLTFGAPAVMLVVLSAVLIAYQFWPYLSTLPAVQASLEEGGSLWRARDWATGVVGTLDPSLVYAHASRYSAKIPVISAAVRDFRINVISPILQALVGFSAFLSALVAADRLFHFYLALFWQRISPTAPEDEFSATPLPDPLSQAARYPKVVVQIPMFNELEVCEQIIDHACELEWPASRILVQVLDDSTCQLTQRRVQDKVLEWKERGANIVVRTRTNRRGYKAGALMDAEKDIAGYEYCAMFDADFSPETDFLHRTIPYLVDNPRVGFVQSRWTYCNSDDSVLTKVQEIGLNYHIKCEQYARFASGNFFNFNGTAGVWRRACIEDAGGWNNRTTVEDMDLSLRAFLRGWNFVFLNNVTCDNELPASYDAFRKQQHRWSCGPMQLWRKAMTAVWESEIPFAQKVYLNLFFFGTRLFATHIVSFVFYCTLVPMCVLTPEVSIPFWALVYVPVMVTLSTTCFTAGSWYYAAHYVLMENAMSIVKMGAMLSGLFELKDAHEWVVTRKTGSGNRLKVSSSAEVDQVVKQKDKAERKIYRRELVMSAFVLSAAAYGILVERRWEYCVFLLLQGAVFAAFGLNLVDGRHGISFKVAD